MHPTPDLETVVRDLDRHVAHDGWAQPPRLFALVVEDGSVSVVEQAWESTGDELLADLDRIAWPADVAGVALSVHRILEPDHDVRVTVGALRDQQVMTALRYRSHDSDDAVAVAAGVVPQLERALWDTLR
jgi:predicted dinucleotide-utilizing enzyme